MLNDFRYALRSLMRRRAFSIIVVLTLALGFGANATILAVVDAVVLRPLPFPDPDRLLVLYETVDRGSGPERRSFSYPDFLAVREGASAFSHVAATSRGSLVLDTDDRKERLVASYVSPAYFDLLGIPPVLGRSLSPEVPPVSGPDADQDAAPGPGENATGGVEAAAAEVVLSHDLWRRLSGSPEATGDRDLLGSALRLGDRDYTVVGVMPQDFERGSMDLWISILERDSRRLQNPHSRGFGVLARLAPEASPASAQQQLDAIFSHLATANPDTNTGYGAAAVSLQREWTGDLRQPVLLLFGAVGLLLIIACANVANMMLIHTLRRRRPAAICLALGARPWHLFRRTLFEAMLLGLAGAGLGVLMAAWGLPLLDRASPVRLPSYATLDINGRVLGLTLLAVTAIGGGLAALTTRLDFAPTHMAVRSGFRTVAGDRSHPWVRRLLLGVEVALAFVVAVGALLLVQSWTQLNRIDPGFTARELVTFQASLPTDAADPEGTEALRAAARRDLLETVAAVPGVESVALASDVPLTGGYNAIVVSGEGDLPAPDESYGGGHRTYRHLVGGGYFETLGLPIVKGRGINASDRMDSQPVAVVSQRLAERLWPGADPIGQRILLGPPRSETADDDPWATVVGLVGEVRHRTLRPDPERIAEDPDLYLALEQFNLPFVAVMARFGGGADSRLIEMQRAVKPLETRLPFFAWMTLEDYLDSQLQANRFSTLLMALFAGLALALSAIGIYGVLTHRVDERRREIGIRIALGANRRLVLRLIARDGLPVIAGGLMLGWVIAWWARGSLGELLYGATATDLGVYLAVTCALCAVSLGAFLLPAQRASRLDPQVILREEE